MAKNDDGKAPEGSNNPPSGGTGGGSPPLQNEEQRIAEQRLAALQDQASTAAGEAEKAKARVAALEGDLEAKEAELKALRRDNEKLTNQVAGLGAAVNRSGLPVLPVELPKGAAQLRESVTILTGAKGTRTAARAGDVIFVKPSDPALEKLRRSIGTVATVHYVDEATAQDLIESGFVIDPDDD